jgi:HEAT repeat protein
MVGSISGAGQPQGAYKTANRSGDDIESLIQDLTNKKAQVRENAVIKLEKFAESKRTPLADKASMVQPLISALSDKNADVRNIAAETLGVLAEFDIPVSSKSAMVDPLIKLSKEEKNRDSQKSAVYSLGNLGISDIAPSDKLKVLAQLISIAFDHHNDKDLQTDAKIAIGDFMKAKITPELKVSVIDYLNGELKMMQDASVPVHIGRDTNSKQFFIQMIIDSIGIK